MANLISLVHGNSCDLDKRDIFKANDNTRIVLPSCSHIRTITWLYPIDPKEMLGKEARWELRKDPACCITAHLI